jgi:large subunit ribosomal protein L39
LLFSAFVSGCGNTTVQGDAEARHNRNLLFTKEKKRQEENIGRIEKIEVQYKGTPEDVTLMMNKGISTPFNCAQRNSFITVFIFS